MTTPAQSGRPLTPSTNAMSDQPPYSITSDMLPRVVEIGETIGRPEVAGVAHDLRLRRINGIRTIQGPLAIEGNMRQTQLLTRWKPLFAHVPVDNVTHAHQSRYYHAIRQSSADGESASFVALIVLDMILEVLRLPSVLPK